MKIKIITGYRDDQFELIDIEEAHKAYYLFLNPSERGIFSNGIAIIGKDIQGIKPDYHSIMGWNMGHKMDSYDWAEVRKSSLCKKVDDILISAKEISMSKTPYLLNKKLSEAVKLLPDNQKQLQ